MQTASAEFPGVGNSHAQLVQRIADGESAAEAELVERFQRGTRLILRRLVGNPALVDDILQETFAVVIAKARAGALREPDRLAGFIRSTARNLLIADRRKEARYAAVEDPEVMEVLLHNESRTRGLASTSEPSQLDRMVRGEEAQLVRQLLDELRFDRDREILFRFYLTDDDKGALCADLGIDPGHFRRVLFRARQRLLDLWVQRRKHVAVGLRKVG